MLFKFSVTLNPNLVLFQLNDAIFVESSAKTGYNVPKLCETIARYFKLFPFGSVSFKALK